VRFERETRMTHHYTLGHIKIFQSWGIKCVGQDDYLVARFPKVTVNQDGLQNQRTIISSPPMPKDGSLLRTG
jgi:hypothetical protein